MTVSGTCHVMGHILLSKAAFKNPRLKVFSFLCDNSRVFEKVNLKKNKKKSKSIILFEKATLTKSHLVKFFFKSEKKNKQTNKHINLMFVLKNYFIHVLCSS